MENIFHLDKEECIKRTVGIIEATNCEKSHIWDRWHNEYGYSWRQGPGWLPTIGELDDRPICISLWFDVINDKMVMFWHATSQVVDYKMIDEWIDKNFPDIRKTDATNAHIVMHMLTN